MTSYSTRDAACDEVTLNPVRIQLPRNVVARALTRPGGERRDVTEGRPTGSVAQPVHREEFAVAPRTERYLQLWGD